MGILDSLGVTFVEKSRSLTIQEWIVTEPMTQIHGILHGGLSAAIAEQGASMGATLSLPAGRQAVGLSMTVQHLRPVSLGSRCRCYARPVQAGGKIQVWQVENRLVEDDTLFSMATVTIYCKQVRDERYSI
ncbi:PaaI family thioesterase [Peptococcus simiae]|uniref:PaaI family thioesterase n=1 Tax=Peptococcus simiae TaxID=1643805 RepID=UPI00397F239B